MARRNEGYIKMIVLRKQYICDFTGKKSFNRDNFFVITLYSGRVFDGYDRYDDDYATYHIHNSVVKKILGNTKNLPPDDEYKKQHQLSIKLDNLKQKFMIKEYKRDNKKNKGKKHGKIN